MYMTKIKTDKVLVDFKGNALKNGSEDLTIGDAIGVVLSGKTSNPTLSWTLGKRFSNDKEVELKIEDAAFLKEVIEKNDMWTSLVTGQLIELLDGTEEKQ